MAGKRDGKDTLIAAITWLARIVVGATFIFSGFTKGIDPWGTIYKFNEYFGVWGMEVWPEINLAGVFILCVAEFTVGFCILFGCFRRTAPAIALLIMAVMLPLTLWLAVENPVSDCGCFGDALQLTNWQTFFKNVILTVLSVWLLVFNRRLVCFINPYLQWIAVTAAGAYLFAVAGTGYYYQPLIDFRPYAIGEPLVENEDLEDEADSEDALLRFVYEKNGEKREFGIDETLPDEEDGWNFVSRYYAEPEEDAAHGIPTPKATGNRKNLRIFSEDGREDITDETVGDGKQLVLMIPNLSEVSAAVTWKINALYDWCNENGIEMIATVGGNPYEIEQWKDISLAEYPIYTSDDTAIEEVVRGNPGVIYLEDGIIKWKSSLRAIDAETLSAGGTPLQPMELARDDAQILHTLSWVFIGITALLVLLSLFPSLVNSLVNHTRKLSKRKKHESKNAG